MKTKQEFSINVVMKDSDSISHKILCQAQNDRGVKLRHSELDSPSF